MNKYEFDPVTHIGKVNGEIWPSVTQLLNRYKLINYDDVPESVLEEKRILGTRVHRASLLLDNNNLDEQHFNKTFPECIPYLEGYRKFRVIEKFEPDEKEVRLFSNKRKFHGSPDEIGSRDFNGKIISVVIDYKGTYHMYKSAGAQLAAYAMLIEENYKTKIKERWGLLLKPSGNYELTQFKDKLDFTDFEACLYMYWRCRNKYKTIKE